MAVAQVNGVGVAGIYAAVPRQLVENASMTALASPAELQKVVKSIGIHRRHVVEPGQCTSDLAEAAAKCLLSDLAWAPETLDLLVFVSQTGDYRLPATACSLQSRLGLSKSCAAFDLGLGCSGYVYGLWVASQLLCSLGGTRALLLVGDTSTSILGPADRSVQFLFGDAATATGLERRPEGNVNRTTFVLGTDGEGAQHLIVPGGGARNPAAHIAHPTGPDAGTRGPFDLFMDGPQVFNFTLREVPALIVQTLKAADISLSSVDRFVFHQANEYLLDYLGRRAQVPPQRMVKALASYGNTSSASIPLTIADKLGADLAEGDLTVLLAGFGVGWSWAAAVMTLEKGTRTRVIEVSPPPLDQAAA